MRTAEDGRGRYTRHQFPVAKVGKVIAATRAANLIDVAFLEGGYGYNIPVVCGWAGTVAGFAHLGAPTVDVDVPSRKTYPEANANVAKPPIQSDPSSLDGGNNDIYALLLPIEGGSPAGLVAIGFIYSPSSELLFDLGQNEEFSDFAIARHESDFQITEDRNATLSVQHPSGARITIGDEYAMQGGQAGGITPPVPGADNPANLPSGSFTNAFDAFFKAAAAGTGISWQLLKALAISESGLNPNAISPPGFDGSRSYGLMQINTNSFPGYSIEELLHNIPLNIALGLKDLLSKLNIYGNLKDALAHYKGWHGFADPSKGGKAAKEVNQVLALADALGSPESGGPIMAGPSSGVEPTSLSILDGPLDLSQLDYNKRYKLRRNTGRPAAVFIGDATKSFFQLDGKGAVLCKDNAGNTISMDGDKTITVENVNGTKVVLDGDDATVEAPGKITATAGGDLEATAGGDMKAIASGDLDATAGKSATLTAAITIMIRAPKVLLGA